MLWILLAQFAVLDPQGPGPFHLLVEPAYTITDLGTLGGDSSRASALNALGEVAGWSATAGWATHAFLYRGGEITDLGTLPGGTHSYATGINDLGQVVGYGGINAYGPAFEEYTQAFIWRDGGMQPLGALYCPCTFNKRYGTSAAYGVNAAGQVVGDSETVRGESFRHAFLWQDGAMHDIGGGAGSFSISFAYGIGDAGQVVGARDGRAFHWQGGVRQDLGTLPGHAQSAGRSVNPLGQVAGESVAADGLRSAAFLWDSGAMYDLGTLPGDLSGGADAINLAAHVVGWSGTPGALVSRAVLWRDGAIHDLNALIPAGSGWVLTRATAINDSGQIAGVGLHDGRPRAFLLTPLPAGP